MFYALHIYIYVVFTLPFLMDQPRRNIEKKIELEKIETFWKILKICTKGIFYKCFSSSQRAITKYVPDQEVMKNVN